jgi:CAAX prenyl protease-like protein
LQSSTSTDQPRAGSPANADLLAPYLLPYAAYVLVATFAGDLPREVDYAIRIVFTAALLFYFRKRYQRLRGPRPVVGSLVVGAAVGVGAAVLWALMILPFQDPMAGDPYTPSAFLLRLVAAATVVPLAEELLCRGYILGLLTQWHEAHRAGAKAALPVALDKRSVHDIAPGAWTGLAVAGSSVAFTMGHAAAQWLAALGFGVVMAGLWIVRRDLVAPITAHAVTNLVLYVYVFATGSWGLW